VASLFMIITIWLCVASLFTIITICLCGITLRYHHQLTLCDITLHYHHHLSQQVQDFSCVVSHSSVLICPFFSWSPYVLSAGWKARVYTQTYECVCHSD
jgi:hypothetical protein